MKVKYTKADDVVVSGTGVTRVIGWGLVAVLVVGGAGYGGYELIWATKASNTQKSSQINRESLGFQQARVDEINLKMADVADLDTVIAETTDPAQKAAQQGQRTALVRIVCADYHQLTPVYKSALDQDQQIEVNRLCQP